MLNYRELLIWLDEHLYEDEEYSIQKWIPKEYNWPLPYIFDGKYVKIGECTIWNEVGSVEYEFSMYKPVNGGTILYDVR